MFQVNLVRHSCRINCLLKTILFWSFGVFLPQNNSSTQDNIVMLFPVEWLHLRRPYCLRTCVEICRGRSGRGRRRRRWRGPLDQFIMRIFEHKVGIRSNVFKYVLKLSFFLLLFWSKNKTSFVFPSISEARDLGVGYFAFSQDEEQRRKQRDTLDMLRDQVCSLINRKLKCYVLHGIFC